VLTHTDLANQKISLADIAARPTGVVSPGCEIISPTPTPPRVPQINSYHTLLRRHPALSPGLCSARSRAQLKALAPNVVQFAHDVERQLNEKIQHKAE
jgi:hypothetical protein